ncbi:MAG: hypothetical protein IT480_03870 [Gammaproteobacteria bacterium]|nr:hypothetical protein [Gammaproteobacteria bacterium]
MAVLVLGPFLRGAPPASPAPSPTAKPARFAEEIRRFREWDRRNSFPKDAVLFVGSSSIRMWPTQEAFADWTVINRGFGGSSLADVNNYFDVVVKPFAAKAIVLDAGDNDIAGGKSPQQVSADFDAFVKLVRATQATVPIYYLSIKPSASRWKHWPAMQEANALIKASCEAGEHLTFVDVGTPLLGENGEPRPELYLEDKLHLSEAGSAIWNKIMREAVKEGR